ncbi:MAG: cupin domain-containing protein [Gammaproteobacteria bacterium]|nr:cupin domain-containing protein [Gammaproteobacteria bacterium]
MNHIEYLRIYTDEVDCSHFEEVKIGLDSTNYAPPAPNLNTSEAGEANKYVFLDLPVDWYGDWHPTPVRQWLALMSGECEFEAGDGEKRVRKAGDIVLLDDTSGKGHQTKVVGNTSVRILAVHF